MQGPGQKSTNTAEKENIPLKYPKGITLALDFWAPEPYENKFMLF